MTRVIQMIGRLVGIKNSLILLAFPFSLLAAYSFFMALPLLLAFLLSCFIAFIVSISLIALQES